MAVTPCWKCGKQIGAHVRYCPFCSANAINAPTWKMNGKTAAGIAFVAFVWWLTLFRDVPESQKPKATQSFIITPPTPSSTPIRTPTPTPSSYWATTVGGYPASFSREAVNKVYRLLAEGDKEAAQEMVERREVFLLKQGEKVRVVETSLFSGMTKIRKQGSSDEFWTVIEAVKTD